jgi:hypothetical protein
MPQFTEMRGNRRRNVEMKPACVDCGCYQTRNLLSESPDNDISDAQAAVRNLEEGKPQGLG